MSKKKHPLPPGVTRSRCVGCKRPIIIVQPTIEVQLGIPPRLREARCEECDR